MELCVSLCEGVRVYVKNKKFRTKRQAVAWKHAQQLHENHSNSQSGYMDFTWIINAPLPLSHS